jgi:microcystin degradation protein MlrC
MLDLQQFRAFGLDPAAHRIVALKSQQHFRAAFAPIAARVIVCDSGALCSPDLRRLPFHRVPRPIFPLD